MKRYMIGFAFLMGLLFSAQVAMAEPVQVRMLTSMGDIELELDRDRAPVTVANFLAYVKKGSYEGTIFHRVISNFMIQGGGFTADMGRKPSMAPIRNEADNGLTNDVGTIAMARTSDPHSASNQFFINTRNNHFLNYRSSTDQGWGYAVFGRVTHGMDVVRKIEAVATGNKAGMQDVPLKPVVIEKVELVQWQDAGAAY